MVNTVAYKLVEDCRVESISLFLYSIIFVILFLLILLLPPIILRETVDPARLFLYVNIAGAILGIQLRLLYEVSKLIGINPVLSAFVVGIFEALYIISFVRLKASYSIAPIIYTPLLASYITDIILSKARYKN